MLCAICSVTQGNCGEDCAYCTQSAKTGTDIAKFKEKSVQQVVDEAKMAYKNHALGFCLVTSGARLKSKDYSPILSLKSLTHLSLPPQHALFGLFDELSALPNLKTGLLKERAEIYKKK